MPEPRKASLAVIFATVFIDLLGFGIVMPLLPRYGEYYQASDATLGLLLSSFSAMQFLFAPIWGRLSDRIGRRPILMLGLAGSTGSYALFGAATSLGSDGSWLGMGALAWLFVSRIGAGIAGATIPTAQAYIADVTGEKERAKGMALIGAAFGAGFTFGPLIGAAFVSDDLTAPPSPMPGYVAAALSAMALCSAIFVLPESLRPGSASAAHRWLDIAMFRRAISRPAIGLILGLMFLTTFAFAQFESTLPRLTKYLGLPDRNNFYVFAYIGLVLTISQGLLVRRLVPKIGEYRMSFAGTILMAGGLLLIGILGRMIDAADRQTSHLLLYLVLPVCVMGFSAVTPSLLSLLSRHSKESEQGGILGVGQSISALARITGPFVGMVLYGQARSWPYWCGAALMLLGCVLVSSLKPAASQSPIS